MARRINGKQKDLDGFSVTRILPNPQQRMVGPFIFFDHMGPAEFEPGGGIDVRPHPHIGLATITYLLEGAMLHRDSLGNNLEIIPGDVNWMTAGSGIVHSERETHEVKAGRHRLDGLQAWVALPEAFAEVQPSFAHIKKAQLPHYIYDGVFARLIIGEAFGMTSPIKTYSPMFYLDAIISGGKTLARPCDDYECAVYVLSGEIKLGNESFKPGDFVMLDEEHEITALNNARVMFIGGEPWERVPHIEWNFVSFSTDRIEQAKADWLANRFPAIDGDCRELTPLPGAPAP